jgi:hypothetical protein
MPRRDPIQQRVTQWILSQIQNWRSVRLSRSDSKIKNHP